MDISKLEEFAAPICYTIETSNVNSFEPFKPSHRVVCKATLPDKNVFENTKLYVSDTLKIGRHDSCISSGENRYLIAKQDSIIFSINASIMFRDGALRFFLEEDEGEYDEFIRLLQKDGFGVEFIVIQCIKSKSLRSARLSTNTILTITIDDANGLKDCIPCIWTEYVKTYAYGYNDNGTNRHVLRLDYREVKRYSENIQTLISLCKLSRTPLFFDLELAPYNNIDLIAELLGDESLRGLGKKNEC